MVTELLDALFGPNKENLGMLKTDAPIYEIVIHVTKVEETKGGKQWKVVGEDDNGKVKQGYTPEITVEKEVRREIYSQSTTDLDLPLVIKAVNKLE